MRYQQLSKEVIDDIIEKFVEKKSSKKVDNLSPIVDKYPLDIKTKK